MSKKESETAGTGKEIAVIGMVGRFPGAGNIDEFWNNLKNGVDSISFFSHAELIERGGEFNSINHSDYVKAKMLLEDKEYFDAAFFSYTPLEAQIMAPQMRIFHECAWAAMEDAGYDPELYDGLIGLYAGASPSSYWEALSYFSGKNDEIGEFAAAQLNDKDYTNTRISYNLNLKGPVFSVQTACSTSLVAVHLACRGLLTGECKMALAGGITVITSPKQGYLFQEGMILSADGHCRAFDARAKGTIFGEGTGLVVLKRLKNAIADNDHIYAVIKGTAINNDGKRKVGFTAPSVDGQAEVIQTAQRIARVQPETIGYIETHGTGTALGDPVEIEALTLAFETDKRGFCAIGSVKSNIGHLDAAAGIAGLIKTVLALKHRQIPPSLHFENPNPGIDFENTPFFVNTGLKEWKNEKYPLRAGVSSFGIGGTNAHAVLEQAPTIPQSSKSREWQLILLSAKTHSALDRVTDNFLTYLEQNPGINLADAAYTLQVGRKALKYKRMAVIADGNYPVKALSSFDSHKNRTASTEKEKKPIVFMFSGQGSQYPDMGLHLYQKEPVFRRELDRCFDLLRPHGYDDIREILYPNSHNASKAEDMIHRVEICHPLLFSFEYALATLLMKWGIVPQAMIGYSLGEYVAAAISGVLSLEDALRLVAIRGKLIQTLPPGGMLSVPLAKKELLPLLKENLSIAIDNGPSCIVSGPEEVIHAFEKQMKKRKYLCIRVRTSHAIHSTMMQPILKEYEKVVGQVTLKNPRIPYISNITGKWLTAEQARDPNYWVNHLKETVRFADGIKKFLKDENTLFVEIGPGGDLGALVSRHLNNNAVRRVITIIRPQGKDFSDVYYLLNKIGFLWLEGVNINWSGLYSQETRHRIPLPTYSFEGQRYWLENDRINPANGTAGTLQLPRKTDMADWFYIPSWKRSLLPAQNYSDTREPPGQSHWLMFMDTTGMGNRLVKLLEKKGEDIIIVRQGKEFSRVNQREYTINAQHSNDYEALIKALKQLSKPVNKIIHLWGVTRDKTRRQGIEAVENAQNSGFYSLLYLAKAIGNQSVSDNLQVEVITSNMQEVSGEEWLCPEKATVLGPAKVIPQEFPFIRCRNIDIVFPETTVHGGWEEDKLARQLCAELSREPADVVVAFRGNHRWIQAFEPVHLPPPPEKIPKLKEKGVYLITGGLGGIGLSLAEFLVRNVRARLILTGRSTLPPQKEWENYLVSHQENDKISNKIRKVKELEALGGEVLVLSADVANREQMSEVIKRAQERFQGINGVIHAAGILGGNTFKTINQIGPLECQKQFQAKVYGLLVLGDIFRNQKLDFCLLTSSLSPILGGLGFVAYSAANQFMDSFVHYYNRKNPVPWISVNWADWRFKHRQEPSALGATVAEFNITPEQGIETFQRILSNGEISQVIVTAGDLQARLDQWVNLQSLRSGDESASQHPSSLQERPNLLNPYVAPSDDIEKILANIWKNLLGFKQVGIQDDFLDLGGDSLKAITVISRIHKEINVTLPLMQFFRRRTIESLSQYIKKAEKSLCTSIEPTEEKQHYVLSSAQKRLYILQQLEIKSIAYNESQTVLLEGEIDKKKLEETFRKLIKRHENLRTSFHMVEEKPVQRIHEELEFDIEYYQVKVEEGEGTRGLAPLPDKHETHSPQSETNIIKNFIRPFDLSQAPLMRVGLLELQHTPAAHRGHPRRGTYKSPPAPTTHQEESPGNRYILMVDMHHIISDGVSHTILIRDLIDFYKGNQLSPLPFQYKDFSEWRNRDEQRKVIESQRDYWLKEFAGEIPVLNLTTDYTRPTIQSFEGNTANFEIGEEETTALNRLAKKQATTLYILLVAMFNVLLARLSNQEDIIIGISLAGRRHADLDQIIGMFVNTLAVRNFPISEKTFTDFFTEVKENTLNAFENQDYPFEELVEQLPVNRDLSRNPLFDVMFVFQNRYFPKTGIPGLKLSPYKYKSQVSKFDLIFLTVESGDKLLFSYEYCTKLFKQETIERFISFYKKIISSILNDPNKKLSQVELISEQEKKQILIDFNDTNAGYPPDNTIHELFEEQVERTPDNLAVVGVAHELPELLEIASSKGTGGLAPLSALSVLMSITYKELNERCNHLAHVLQSKGTGSDMIVGIMIEPSVEMIIGILGILKAGGAYLPIDPTYPEERIKYKLADTSAKILVTTRSLVEEDRKLGTWEGKKIILEEVFKDNNGSSHPAARNSQLAYIIYTSGSTGKPKGVMVEHRSVVNRLNWMQRFYPIRKDDVILQKIPFTFDVSAWELFRWSFQGASLCLLGPGDEKKPGAIIEAVEKDKVTTMHFVPSMLRVFLAYLDQYESSSLSRLRRVFSSGEELKVDLVEKFNKLLKQKNGTRLINLYGTSETAGNVSYFDCSTGGAPGNILIGKPIDNIALYVLDKALNVQPPGVPGELYIAGEGLCQGYLNCPESTAEKFPENPFASPPGNLLHRTGDLCRWLPDGNLEFLGRSPQQAKINGNRIELKHKKNELIVKEITVSRDAKTSKSRLIEGDFDF
ncbi:MAG: amino acid adenylation domain-containing protein [Candidatus Aminicenantes bacterium]|nr:MAG: amino acid adenylation domain-containing protein [Candidatus Aminicenantes bacterium]